MNNYKNIFPYKSIRQEQQTAIDFGIKTLIESDKKFCIIEAGTGVGKSAIGLTLGRYLDDYYSAHFKPDDIDYNQGTYFLSVSAGQLIVDREHYLAISVSSPIGKLLLGKQEKEIVDGLKRLPGLINETLLQEGQIKKLSARFKSTNSSLFLGRGTMHAIAMEGALKLKEISYIHAEAYPAGELKHGPIALIDKNMPVIAIAPNDELLEKLKSNLQEVKSRGSQMIVFEDTNSRVKKMDGMEVIPITSNLGRITAPIIFTIPLQLLSYHVAITKGTDIDKPRNLAKSVTVE